MARRTIRQRPRHCLQMVHQHLPTGFVYFTTNVRVIKCRYENVYTSVNRLIVLIDSTMTKSTSKKRIALDSGVSAEAQTPIIVSASRSTDIPAFYADWFFERLKRGYSAWTNPFSGVTSYVSYRNTRFIVFWRSEEHTSELQSRI